MLTKFSVCNISKPLYLSRILLVLDQNNTNLEKEEISHNGYLSCEADLFQQIPCL